MPNPKLQLRATQKDAAAVSDILRVLRQRPGGTFTTRSDAVRYSIHAAADALRCDSPAQPERFA
jgi:hypothetical protein